MSSVVTVHFTAGHRGQWAMQAVKPVIGETLALAERLQVHGADVGGADVADASMHWRLRGVVSNLRYSQAKELFDLDGVSPPLRRTEARLAALIPIRKSAAWWSLAQDERRHIFEEQSGHISRSMKYLPAIARRLHHSRDLGEDFDFLTWFEYAPADEAAFEVLLDELRASAEWTYVEREVDVRLARID